MKIKTFTLFWLTGETQLIKGTDITTAMNNAGIGNGALRALDFYAEGDKEKDYTYVNANKGWHLKSLFADKTVKTNRSMSLQSLK